MNIKLYRYYIYIKYIGIIIIYRYNIYYNIKIYIINIIKI